MKLIIITLSVLISLSAGAQEISGMWYGMVNLGGVKLRTDLELIPDDNGWKVTMYSPDQTDQPIEGGTATIAGDSVYIIHERLKLTYDAKYSSEREELSGTFNQGAYRIPLVMTRTKIEKPEIKRPQTPTESHGKVEEIIIRNDETGLDIGATVTFPSGDIKTAKFVIMASGSGAQDRDENIMEHKPFAVLADHLCRQGIASIRFDDRGTGKSGGTFSGTDLAGFASDIRAVYNYARSRKDASQVGLLGHSEGGMHIMITNKEVKGVDFMIFLACAGVKGEELYLKQHREIAAKSGETEEEAQRTVDFFKQIIQIGRKEKNPSAALQRYLGNYYDSLSEEEQGLVGSKFQFQAGLMAFCNNDWFRDFMDFEPADYWKSMKKVPTLVLNGTKDVQVDCEMNIAGFEKGLTKVKNPHFETHKMEGMNHLFQKCETGLVAEYGEIETTIEPEVLKIISGWINKL